MRSPGPISEGAHLRVISPAWPALFYTRRRLAAAEAVMAELGLRVSYGEYAKETTADGMSAGSPQQRAADFTTALTDPHVDVVLSAFGGESTQELLPYLDAEALRGTTTPFIGVCDNVWLNQFLYQEVGLTSYYGVSYVGEFKDPFPETLDYFRRALMSSDDLVCLPMAARTDRFDERPRRLDLEGGWQWLRPKRAVGPLLGGELGTLVQLVDHFDMKLDDAVLFWDIGLPNKEDPRELLGRLAAKVSLERLAGMVVGPDRRYRPAAWAATVEEALASVAPGASYPVVVNADLGHLDPKWVVPYGEETILDPDRGVVFPRRRAS